MKGVDEPDIINSYKQSATRFQLLEEPIDFARPFKIAISELAHIFTQIFNH